jgi:hypothetical protein
LGAGFALPDASGADAPTASGPCAEEVQTARPALDLLLLIDRSGSMSINVAGAALPKWVAVRNGLTGFVERPETAGLGVGVQFFPLQPRACTADSDCVRDGDFCQASMYCRDPSGQFSAFPCGRGYPVCQGAGLTCVPGGVCPISGGRCSQFGQRCPDGPAGDLCSALPSTCFEFVDCKPGPYRTPLVPLVELPAGQGQVLAGLALASANGRATPILAAVTGAHDYLRAHQQANPGRRPVLVFASDGASFGCSDGAADITAALAAARAGTPPVPTYVIGVTEDAGDMGLRSYAAAGGTGAPFVVAATGDLEQRFLAVLNEIRGRESTCDFTIPKPMTGAVDPGKVNVQLQVAGTTDTLPYVVTAARCDDRGGWYYDLDPAGGTPPARVILCPASCQRFKSDGRNKVDLRFGCQTISID